jgi:hypothetical protein
MIKDIIDGSRDTFGVQVVVECTVEFSSMCAHKVNLLYFFFWFYVL